MKLRRASLIAVTATMVASGAWAQVAQSPGASAYGPALLAPVALPLDGTWLTYDVFMNEGDFFPDNWEFTSSDPVTVQITDWAVVTDTYDVFNNGGFIFSSEPTPPAANWDDLGFADPFTSPPYTTDPDTAWGNPVFSKGWVTLPPGSHSITVQNTQIPPTAAGEPFGDSTMAIRASIVPGCDIKPGSFPNSINIYKKKGVIPVGLLGSDNLDVADIDVASLTFEGAYPAHDLSDPFTYAEHIMYDVNGDGFIDLVSHYNAPETNLHGGSTEGTITGEIGGVPFSCTDSVRIVGGGS